MIELVEATYTNFFSIRESQTLPLAKQGLTCIDGDNGAMKSGLVDGIVWAFFGKPARKLKSKDEVVNRFEKHDCSVSVPFRRDGVNYVVTRYLKHAKYKNRVVIEAEGKDITLKDRANAQISEILGHDYTTFLRALLFTKRDTVSLAALGDEEQKIVFEKMLGLDAIQSAYKAALEEARGVKNDTALLQSKIDTAQEDLAHAETLVETLTRERESFEAQKQERVEELTKRIEELTNKLNEAATVTGEVGELKALVRKRLKKVNRAKKELRIAKEEALKATNLRSERNALRSVTHRQVADLTERTTSLFKSTTCAQCGQPLTPDHHAHLQKQLEEWQAREAEDDKAFSALHKQYLSATSAQEGASKRLDALRKALHQASARLGALREAKQRASASQDAIRQELAREEGRLSQARASHWQGAPALKGAERTQATRRETLEQLKIDVYRKGKQLRYLDFWVHGFGKAGIPSHVIDTAIPFLAQKTQEYADRLANGAFKINFSTKTTLKNGETREKFATHVENKFGAGSYHGNSVGELGKVDLAITLAYQALQELRSSARLNCVFMDEVFDGQSKGSVDSILELLSDLSAKKDSLFVISHDENLRQSFHHVIHMQKKGRTSHIILGSQP